MRFFHKIHSQTGKLGLSGKAADSQRDGCATFYSWVGFAISIGSKNLIRTKRNLIFVFKTPSDPTYYGELNDNSAVIVF